MILTAMKLETALLKLEHKNKLVVKLMASFIERTSRHHVIIWSVHFM